jgi:predicted secreted acid phosphatase
MLAVVRMPSGRAGHRAPERLRQALPASALVTILIFGMPMGLKAADCPAERQPNIPKSEEPALNIDKHKKQLRAYHQSDPASAHNSAYEKDIKLVIDDALAYVMNEYDKVKRPAVVLDIDETSLTNWRNIDADDFGFIKDGECTLRPQFPCGFNAWIEKGRADKIGPTLDLFNAVRSKRIAVFFVTGRHDSQRGVTIRNLKRAGFDNWAGLMTRPDDDHSKSIVPFKSGERAKIENEGKGEHYTIIANIGDQQSDLDGGHAECTFKLPNPFYFIE